MELDQILAPILYFQVQGRNSSVQLSGVESLCLNPGIDEILPLQLQVLSVVSTSNTLLTRPKRSAKRKGQSLVPPSGYQV